jgi:hypothetical protein
MSYDLNLKNMAISYPAFMSLLGWEIVFFVAFHSLKLVIDFVVLGIAYSIAMAPH